MANLLSGAVAKPDFGALLKAHEGQDTAQQMGTILWYNGRRKCGVLLADRDECQLRRLGNRESRLRG